MNIDKLIEARWFAAQKWRDLASDTEGQMTKENWEQELRTLLSEVLEAVRPERVQAWNDPMRLGYNSAIDEMERKQRKLGL
jgi:hypothetical protein